MEYKETINYLNLSINNKGFSHLFKQSITDLKNKFKVEVSTKFLRSLSDLPNNRNKTKRISYLIRINNLKTKRTTNLYKVRGINKYKTSVTEWGHDKKTTPYPETIELTEDERRQLTEIEAVKEDFEVDFISHIESDLIDQQKTRNAFNHSGGAVVRDTKVIQVGGYAIMTREEVLFMVC